MYMGKRVWYTEKTLLPDVSPQVGSSHIEEFSSVVTNTSLSFIGPALCIFHLHSISCFIKELLLGQDRRVVLEFAYNTFLFNFALRLKMLDIADVLRVVWMLMCFPKAFHSVAFPEVLNFTVSELSKSRIFVMLDCRNPKRASQKMLSMNNSFKRSRNLSVLQGAMAFVFCLLFSPVVPRVLLRKRQRTTGEYWWFREPAPRKKCFNMKVAALSLKSSKASLKF